MNGEDWNIVTSTCKTESGPSLPDKPREKLDEPTLELDNDDITDSLSSTLTTISAEEELHFTEAFVILKGAAARSAIECLNRIDCILKYGRRGIRSLREILSKHDRS